MAGAQAGFRVEGVNRLVRDLTALGLEVDDLKSAFSKIADEGAEVASRYAPRKAGALAGDVRGNRAKSKAVVMAGRSRIAYAGPQNYGWPARNIAASNFMQKADEHMRPVAITRLEDEINNQIRKKGLA